MLFDDKHSQNTESHSDTPTLSHSHIKLSNYCKQIEKMSGCFQGNSVHEPLSGDGQALVHRSNTQQEGRMKGSMKRRI
jgi:hypothetical protein